MMFDAIAVPDDHSAVVTWQPARSCHVPVAGYRVVAQPGNVMVNVPGNVTTATVTGLQNSAGYSFTVTAINAYGEDTVQSNSVIAGPHCTSAGLTISPASPQFLGTRLQLTASSAGCPNPSYEFWVNTPDGTWVVGRQFGGGTWSWDTSRYPAGDYTIHVWANQTGDNNNWETFAEVKFSLPESPPCTSASLSPSTTTQPAASSISFTAGASGCPIALYAYWIGYANGTWTMQRDFSTNPTWSWNTAGLPPGTYTVHAWANHPGHSTTSLEVFGSSTVTLTGCTSASLSPAAPSQPAGSSVAFTAASGGCLNAQYEYWVQYPNGSWYMKRGFSSDAAFSWSTTGLVPGTYTVHVWANHAGDSMAKWEAYGQSIVQLSGCTSATLSPASGSYAAGTPVVFTAGSAGCPNPVYAFWIQDTLGRWRLMQAFGANTWTWSNLGWPKGVYHIHVWANQQGADMGSFEMYASSTVTLS
jgi:hypothetical protein